jgi:hypothetical protein
MQGVRSKKSKQIGQSHDQKIKEATKSCPNLENLSQIIASISAFPITYKQQTQSTPG